MSDPRMKYTQTQPKRLQAMTKCKMSQESSFTARSPVSSHAYAYSISSDPIFSDHHCLSQVHLTSHQVRPSLHVPKVPQNVHIVR